MAGIAVDIAQTFIKELKAMSWSASTIIVTKAKAPDAIDRIEIPQSIEAPALDQVFAAQRAAKELLKSIPGPLVRVTMSGHANGVGWQKKEGWSDDSITVTVTQVTANNLDVG